MRSQTTPELPVGPGLLSELPTQAHNPSGYIIVKISTPPIVPSFQQQEQQHMPLISTGQCDEPQQWQMVHVGQPGIVTGGERERRDSYPAPTIPFIHKDACQRLVWNGSIWWMWTGLHVGWRWNDWLCGVLDLQWDAQGWYIQWWWEVWY